MKNDDQPGDVKTEGSWLAQEQVPGRNADPISLMQALNSIARLLRDSSRALLAYEHRRPWCSRC